MQHEPSPAAGIAAALGAHAEAVCRRYLPHGRKLGRYWVAGDIDGARGRSLFVRLSGSGARQVDRCRDGAARRPARPHPPSLKRRRCARRSTRRGQCRRLRRRARATRRHRTAPRHPCRAPISARADCRNAASRRCASIPSFAIAKARRCAGSRRWSPPSPATTAPCSACSAPGSIRAAPAKAGVTNPRKALGRIFGHAVRFGAVPADGLASLVVGEGIETVLSLVASVPEIGAAAALSAGSLGAFAPPPGVARLSSSRGTTIRTVHSRPNASPGAARGRASPPRSSSRSATISTTTSRRSARRRCAPGSRRSSASPPPRTSIRGERRRAE